MLHFTKCHVKYSNTWTFSLDVRDFQDILATIKLNNIKFDNKNKNHAIVVWILNVFFLLNLALNNLNKLYDKQMYSMKDVEHMYISFKP